MKASNGFLHGGPLDGLWLSDEHVCADRLLVVCNYEHRRLAVYERDYDSWLLEFVGYRSGREFHDADIWPSLRETKGGAS